MKRNNKHLVLTNVQVEVCSGNLKFCLRSFEIVSISRNFKKAKILQRLIAIVENISRWIFD